MIGDNREQAIIRMQRALSEFKIEGIKTTIPLFQKIMQHEVFQKGEAYTDFIAKYMTATPTERNDLFHRPAFEGLQPT